MPGVGSCWRWSAWRRCISDVGCVRAHGRISMKITRCGSRMMWCGVFFRRGRRMRVRLFIWRAEKMAAGGQRSMRRYLGSRMRMGCCGQNGSQTGNKIREFTEMIVGRMHGEAEMRMKMHKTEQKQKVQKNGGIREKAELEKTDHPRMKRRHSQVCSQQEPSTPEIPASF